MVQETKFRSLESLSDSDEEIHPNIDTKSYRKFIKEQRSIRLEELRAKKVLTVEESKELKELEYKLLPVVVEIPEDTFRLGSKIKKEFVEEIVNFNNKNDFVSEMDNSGDKNPEIEDFEDERMMEYANDLENLLNNNNVKFFIDFLDSKQLDLDLFEELVYFNLSSLIKENEDEIGLEVCKIGLMTKWAREYGRSYLVQICNKEDKLDQIVKDHYKLSKEAILNLNRQN